MKRAGMCLGIIDDVVINESDPLDHEIIPIDHPKPILEQTGLSVDVANVGNESISLWLIVLAVGGSLLNSEIFCWACNADHHWARMLSQGLDLDSLDRLDRHGVL